MKRTLTTLALLLVNALGWSWVWHLTRLAPIPQPSLYEVVDHDAVYYLSVPGHQTLVIKSGECIGVGYDDRKGYYYYSTSCTGDSKQ